MKKALSLALPLVAVLWGLLVPAQTVGAQASPGEGKPGQAYAEIVFYEGEDLLVLRSSGKIESEEPLGLRLLPGDQIQTGAKTSVELVLLPRRSRIRLSENTAVAIRDLGGGGSTELQLLYGRLRSKVAKLASGSAPYSVSSQSCVAGVRGTDFGCDVLIARSGAPAPTRVYCFEGSVEVEPNVAAQAAAQAADDAAPSGGAAGGSASAAAPAADAVAKAAAIVISAGAMALVEAATEEKAASVVERPIEDELRAYWKANDFTLAQPKAVEALASEPAPAQREAAPAALPPPPAASEVDWKTIRSRLAVKDSAIVGASTFLLGGAALCAASFGIRNYDSSQADTFLVGGAIWAAAGLPILIFSISVDPLKGIAPAK